jgi:hypothetical protein
LIAFFESAIIDRYVKLFSLEAEHIFYAGGIRSAFRYVATGATAEVVSRRSLLIRPACNGIAVFIRSSLEYEPDADVEVESTPILAFKIFAEDPYFTQYTVPMSQDAYAVPYLQSDCAKVDDDGRWRLHEQEYVDASVLQRIDGPTLAPHLSRKDVIVKPEAVVAVALGGGAAADPRRYYLRFSARKSLWKYYYVSEADAKNYSIVDLDNEIRFECTGAVNLPGNKRALMFLSNIEIEMRRMYARRFQLREQNGMGEKVLIRRLPNASVSRMGLDEKGVLTAEIYIN